MNKYIPDNISVTDAVRRVIPGTYHIRKPFINGALQNVRLADTQNGTYVCKFTRIDLASKNTIASDIMHQANICVPQIKVHSCKDFTCEYYPEILGRPLYELSATMHPDKIRDTYYDVLLEFAKMDNIFSAPYNDNPIWQIHYVARNKISNTNGKFVGNVSEKIIKSLNSGKKGLYHCGITPKNIIVTNDCKLQGIIGMDQVVIASKDYAFAIMAAHYEKLGFDVNELVHMYRERTMEKLDAGKIRRMVSVINAGTNILRRIR